MNDATLDNFTERAAIIWADECTCDPMPPMPRCKCGAKVDAETTAADLCGVRVQLSTRPKRLVSRLDDPYLGARKGYGLRFVSDVKTTEGKEKKQRVGSAGHGQFLFTHSLFCGSVAQNRPSPLLWKDDERASLLDTRS